MATAGNSTPKFGPMVEHHNPDRETALLIRSSSYPQPLTIKKKRPHLNPLVTTFLVETMTVKSSTTNASVTTITVQKPSKETTTGLGLTAKAGVGVVVSSIKTGSIFRDTKLRVGSHCIVRVNGYDCTRKSSEFVAQQLLSAPKGKLTVVVREVSDLEMMEIGGAGGTIAKVEDFAFMTAVLMKTSVGAKVGIIVSEKTAANGKTFPIIGTIQPKSLASKTKLREGLRILTINGVSCLGSSDTAAMLKQAPAKVQIRAGNSRMLIVSANKPRDGKFGFRLGKSNGTVVVSSVAQDGLLAKTGLEVGMQVLKVNGKNVSTLEMPSVQAIIANGQKKLILLVEESPPPDTMTSGLVPPGALPGGQWGTGNYVGPCSSILFCICCPLFGLFGLCCLAMRCDKGKPFYLSPNGRVYDAAGEYQGTEAYVGFRPNPPGSLGPQENPESEIEKSCGPKYKDTFIMVGLLVFLALRVAWVVLRFSVSA